MTSGAQPSFDEMLAPIICRGSMIRCIGRERRESSPVKVEVKSCPAKIPATKRIVVPLLPQSSGPLGARNPLMPTPFIARTLLSCSIPTPSARKQESVAAQSALLEKFLICEVPSARAANIAARCEIDLSPGISICPRNVFAGLMITSES
jgi:hypothetical protein